jgi:hypothetical protein
VIGVEGRGGGGGGGVDDGSGAANAKQHGPTVNITECESVTLSAEPIAIAVGICASGRVHVEADRRRGRRRQPAARQPWTHPLRHLTHTREKREKDNDSRLTRWRHIHGAGLMGKF